MTFIISEQPAINSSEKAKEARDNACLDLMKLDSDNCLPTLPQKDC